MTNMDFMKRAILLSIDNGKSWEPIFSNILDSKRKKIELPFISKTSTKCKIKMARTMVTNINR